MIYMLYCFILYIYIYLHFSRYESSIWQFHDNWLGLAKAEKEKTFGGSEVGTVSSVSQVSEFHQRVEWGPTVLSKTNIGSILQPKNIYIYIFMKI